MPLPRRRQVFDATHVAFRDHRHNVEPLNPVALNAGKHMRAGLRVVHAFGRQAVRCVRVIV